MLCTSLLGLRNTFIMLTIYHIKKMQYVKTIEKRQRLVGTKVHLKWTEAKKEETALWSDKPTLKPLLETKDALSSVLKIGLLYKCMHDHI